MSRGFGLGLLLFVATAVSAFALAEGAVPSIHWPEATDTEWAVRVEGLAAKDLEALRELAPSSRQWEAVLSVGVDGAGDLPALLGAYSPTEGGLRFVPRFAPSPGLRLVARFDGGAFDTLVGRSSSTRSVEARLAPTDVPGPPQARVTHIDPASETVPANLLRVYVHFSSAMAPTEVHERVHLLDADGREIALAFVEIRQGLWDPGRRRLTLFLHPGRIKRGVAPREELGPILRSGDSFSIRIDRELLDAAGRSLVGSYQRSFRVGPEDRQSPDPSNWILSPPLAPDGALRAEFPEPLDRALLESALVVEDDRGRPIEGRVRVDDGARSWTFRPDWPWSEVPYSLVVSPRLEDLAGNRVGQLFEETLLEGSGTDRQLSVQPVRLPFRPIVPRNPPRPRPRNDGR